MSKRNYLVTPEKLGGFNYTMRAMLSVALRRGWMVEYSEAMPDNSSSGIAYCTKKGREIVFRSNSTILSPIYGYFASENKSLSAALFEKNGVPTPWSVVVSVGADTKELKKYLKKHGKLVVKPLDTNHGDGITVGVDSMSKLNRAVKFASDARPENDFVLLQKQIDGAREYRFLVLDGRVIAVAYRRVPFVVGDGVSSVRELIARVNSDPLRGDGHKSVLSVIKLEDVMEAFGKEFLDVIPEKGAEIEVLKTSNLSRGGIAEDYTDRVSLRLKEIAVLAAKSCFLGLAGVDIMTTDVERGDDA